jgi:D-cysteine desulfhydrase
MKRLHLAHLPTPIVQPKRLADAIGLDLWVKRDDVTAGAESGNKIRKLELLLADALAKGADTLLTCGGVQSNHARATALLGASLGLGSVLYLRTTEPGVVPDGVGAWAPWPEAAPLTGNVVLDRLAGAEIRLITPASYRERGRVMEEAAQALAAAGKRPYVIPEGGSNGLGSLGYVHAMAEVRRQLDLGLGGGRAFDLVVLACGSGGTAAGVTLGAAQHEVARAVRAMAVCDDAPTFERVIDRIIGEAVALEPSLGRRAELVVDDSAKGPAYAVSTLEQRRRIAEVARLSGLVLDPVYTGKAFSGLWDLVDRGVVPRGARVLFLHTGGLPGLIAQGEELRDAL